MTPKEKADQIFTIINNRLEEDPQFRTEVNAFTEIQISRLIAEEGEKAEYNLLIKFGFITKNYKSYYWQEVIGEIDNLPENSKTMIQIITLEEVRPGDFLLIDGHEDKEVRIITVDSVEDDCIIAADSATEY